MRRRPRRSEAGFTYVAILLAVAMFGTILAAMSTVWYTAQKREKERELLFVGDQFRKAIRSYAAGGAGVAGAAPQSLDDLLRDPRTPGVTRHLRKIFVDPMTATTDWGLVKTPDGKGILGVYSRSEDAPLKTANFGDDDKSFEGKTKYSDWKFVSSAVALAPDKGPTQPAQPTAPGVLAPGLQRGGVPVPAQPQPSPAIQTGASPVQPQPSPAIQTGASPVQPQQPSPGIQTGAGPVQPQQPSPGIQTGAAPVAPQPSPETQTGAAPEAPQPSPEIQPSAAPVPPQPAPAAAPAPGAPTTPTAPQPQPQAPAPSPSPFSPFGESPLQSAPFTSPSGTQAPAPAPAAPAAPAAPGAPSPAAPAQPAAPSQQPAAPAPGAAPVSPGPAAAPLTFTPQSPAAPTAQPTEPAR